MQSSTQVAFVHHVCQEQQLTVQLECTTVTHTQTHTCIMKLLLQPPTTHLVLWFDSGAFYKHNPGEHGEQVSQWQL